MDEKTRRYLARINHEAAMKHRRTLLQRVKTFAEEKQMLEARKRDGRLSSKARERIARLLESKKLHWDRESQIINEKATAAIEREVEVKVRSALRRGIIPKPVLDAKTRRLFPKRK